MLSQFFSKKSPSSSLLPRQSSSLSDSKRKITTDEPLSVASNSNTQTLPSTTALKQTMSTPSKPKSRHRQPPVYEEVVAMLAGSLLIYLLADLRDMAREADINNNNNKESRDKILLSLEPPMTTEQIMQQIQYNKEALENRDVDHVGIQKRLDALQSLKEEGTFQTMFFASKQQKQQRTIMTHFGDAKCKFCLVPLEYA